MNKNSSIFWFRRDLRLSDNAGLYHALKDGTSVQCIFIFDTDILDLLEDKKDARVHFIYLQIVSLKKELNKLGSDLWVFYGKPSAIFERLFNEYTFQKVYCNHDYEPKAKQRDEDIKQRCKAKNIGFHSYKDQVIFEKKRSAER